LHGAPPAAKGGLTMAEVFKNYIDGAWVEAKSGKTFENRNPANRHDLIGLFPASGPDDIDQAVRAAKKAFAHWRLVTALKLGEILYRVSFCGSIRKRSLAV
jgi:aldehyde dehydrogenase (NAD+)